jgi:hypothetical protein
MFAKSSTASTELIVIPEAELNTSQEDETVYYPKNLPAKLNEVKELLFLRMSTILGVKENEFFERSSVFNGVLCNNLTTYFNPVKVISLPRNESTCKKKPT